MEKNIYNKEYIGMIKKIFIFKDKIAKKAGFKIDWLNVRKVNFLFLYRKLIS